MVSTDEVSGAAAAIGEKEVEESEEGNVGQKNEGGWADHRFSKSRWRCTKERNESCTGTKIGGGAGTGNK